MRFALLDTNILLWVARGGSRLGEEIAHWADGTVLAVPAVVRRELDHLAEGSVPYARVARMLGRRYPTVPCYGEGDSAILDCARRSGAVLVTADRALAQRARASGVDVLTPRDRSHLTRRAGLVRSGPERGRPGIIIKRTRLVRRPS